MTRLMLLFLLFLASFHSRAQFADKYNYQFKQFTVAEGLADNSVIKSVKDKYGFLWIATLNGISRFDGVRFKNYTAQTNRGSGLRSGWTSDIIVDAHQQLWASTEGGLCYYNESSDRFIYINEPDQLQLIYKMPLVNGDNNSIWLVAEDGLRKVNTVNKTYTSTSLRRIIDPQFVSLALQGDRLLIGTRGHGLWEYTVSTDQYKKTALPDLPANVHLMDGMSETNGTWIACSEGLLWLERNGRQQLYNRFVNTNYKADALMCVARFDNAFGNRYLICGSYDKKLMLFDTEQKLFCYQWKSGYSDPAGFNAATLNDLYGDNDLLWLSGNRGLQLLNLKAQQQQSYYVEGLHDAGQTVFVKKAIPSFSEGKTSIWMIPSQPANGIIHYDLPGRKITNHYERNTIYNDVVESKAASNIVAGAKGKLDFFGSGKGLMHSVKVDGDILCIRQDRKGNWWAGLEDGIAFIDNKSREVKKYPFRYDGSDLENNTFGGPFPVYDIVCASDSMIYLASLKYGLFDFNINKKKFTAHRIKAKSSFSTDNRSVALAYTGADTLYSGTFNGMSAFNMLQQKFAANLTGELPGPVYIYSMVTDSSRRVWARTNSGLLNYEPASGKLNIFSIKGEADISNWQQRLALYDSSHIIIGHEGGFSILNSSAILDQPFPAPSLYMNKVMLNDKEIFFKRDSTSNWKFNHRQNQLSFEVAAIEYNNPEGIEYYYKLDGVDKTWKEESNKNSFNYNFLPPGQYRFCIYTRNTINNTQSTVLYFAFTIQPAWWQHWWLWPLLALLFAAIVLYFARRRIRGIRRREAAQTNQNKMMAELELKMLRSQMNPHFIFNSLNSIQKYIWENKEEDAAEYLASFAKLMRAILELSRKELVSLKEESTAMKLYIQLEHRRSNGSFEYNVHIDEQLDQDRTLVPPMIMQPFIENAIWHGLNKKGSKGQLNVSVKKIDQQLLCVIEDDGNGFEPGKKVMKEGQASLGIEITRQRLEKLMHNTGLRAEVRIESKNISGSSTATGTIVSIYLPLQTI